MSTEAGVIAARTMSDLRVVIVVSSIGYGTENEANRTDIGQT